MKNKQWEWLKNSVKPLVIALASMTVLLLLLDLISGGLIVDYIMYALPDFIYVHTQNFAYHLVNNKVFVYLQVLILTVLLVLLYQYWKRRIIRKKTVEQCQLVLDSIDEMFSGHETMIHLPDEFKETENKLNALRNESLQNERLAKEAEQRKNDLVVYLAHDLKTPLTSVIGYLTLLHDEREISPELQEKYLGIALDKANRLEDLINEFFDITRFNLQNVHLEKGRVNLSVMLLQLVDEFYPVLCEKKIECKLDVGHDLILTADSDKIARVFDNLLRNAVSYCYENSEIRISAAKENGRMVIRFENEGMPIPKHKLDSIFEKFYRLDSARSSKTGGAGLGLAIAKEIVTLHRGTITAESDEQSTRFTIVLPCTE